MKRKILIALWLLIAAIPVSLFWVFIVSKGSEDIIPRTATCQSDPPTVTRFQVSDEDMVFGGMVKSKYKGYTYLTYEELTLPITFSNYLLVDLYVPQGIKWLDRRHGNIKDHGVEFDISLNPGNYSFHKDITPEAKLEDYLNFQYYVWNDGIKKWNGLEISDIQEQENGVSATVKYYVDSTQGKCDYQLIWNTYYYAEFPDGLSILVCVGIPNSEVFDSGKEQFLQELAQFYQFDIGWSQEAADQEIRDFLAGGKAKANMVSTENLMFEIPEGWDWDPNNAPAWDPHSVSDGDHHLGFHYICKCAPGGNAESAGCSIMIQKFYTTKYSEYGDALERLIFREPMEEDEYLASIEELLKPNVLLKIEDAGSVTLENYEDTVLGPAMKGKYISAENGREILVEVYFTEDYIIVAQQSSDSAEDVFAVVENILETAVIRPDY